MMAWMEMDYKMDFWKLFRMNFFQIAKFGLEIFESVVLIRNTLKKLPFFI